MTQPNGLSCSSFNGGPGSSAVWLHLGAFGPKRVSASSDPVNAGGPPYQMIDNPYTLLRFSDLVFVDPIGTGYSRAMGKRILTTGELMRILHQLRNSFAFI